MKEWNFAVLDIIQLKLQKLVSASLQWRQVGFMGADIQDKELWKTDANSWEEIRGYICVTEFMGKIILLEGNGFD